MIDDMPRTVEVTDDRILAAFECSPSPVCTVADLEEELPLKMDGIRDRLKKLEERGCVESKKVGARAVVWWRTGECYSSSARP